MAELVKVLVVDDEQDILDTLEYFLTCRGYEVSTTTDGLLALDLAKQDPPDIMLLDVMLPGCNGYEVSRMLKDWMQSEPEGPSFPILLLTARKVDSEEREKFIATWSQADACLYKPFEMDEVLQRITELTSQVSSVD